MHDYKDSTSAGPIGGRGWPGHARRVKWPLVFGAAWVLLAAIDIGLLISSSRGLHAIARTTPAATRAASATPAPSASASASPASASYLFRPASAAAFGPQGAADGDDPGRAAAAVDSSQATAWTTSWYLSPKFGNLKRGTGLLLDLGSAATIAGVRLELQPAHGADLQVLTGDAPVRTALVT